ncbi:hypothetical protein GGI13_002223 [Coemansia sp. RSA 455]|nr:hypothetical protein GGI13_002223 [Coemansia sp. RSA 455]
MSGIPILNTVEELQRFVFATASTQVNTIYVIPYFNYLDKNAQTEAQAMCGKQGHRPLCIFTGEHDVALRATQDVGKWKLMTLPFEGPLQLYEYMEIKRMSHKFTIPFDEAMNHQYRMD